MSSWIFVFSKFTPEALLFESFAICMLCSGYAAFWVLKKRKLGVADTEVPAGVIRGYLTELIVDAEQLRAQLFGLLRSAGVNVGMDAGSPAPMAGAAQVTDAAMLQKLAQFEAKIADKDKAMQALLADKSKMEKDLANAKAATKGAPGGADPAVMNTLQEKISNLEAKLAEYSVIEDDLANLKRLQQENAQLKAALAGQGGIPESITSAAAPVAAAPAPTPVAAAAIATPIPAAVSEPVAAIAAAEATAAAAAPEAAFEGLVDQVEQSLQPDAAPAAPAATEASTPEAAPASMEKSDADLVAEFEKMLNT